VIGAAWSPVHQSATPTERRAIFILVARERGVALSLFTMGKICRGDHCDRRHDEHSYAYWSLCPKSESSIILWTLIHQFNVSRFEHYGCARALLSREIEMTRAELMRHALSQRRAARLISCGRDAVGLRHSITAGNDGIG
jgi:hypothetical protein